MVYMGGFLGSPKGDEPNYAERFDSVPFDHLRAEGGARIEQRRDPGVDP
jgi:hypothetical protein